MDPEELKKVLKIHGNRSEEDSDSESKIVCDLYEKYKPSPILIDPKIHKIIEVGSNDLVGCQKEVKEKDFEPTNWEVKLTKSQKKRQRKMQQQNRINVTKVENEEEASKKKHEESDYVYFENKKETASESNGEQNLKFEIGGCHKKENVLSREHNEFFKNREFRSKTDSSGKNLKLQASQLCFLNYTEEQSMGIEENYFCGDLRSITLDEYLENIKEERRNGQIFLKNEDFPIHLQEDRNKVENRESKESELSNKNIHFQNDTKKKRNRKRKKNRITEVVTQNRKVEYVKFENVIKVTFSAFHKQEDVLHKENNKFLEHRKSKIITDKSGTNLKLDNLRKYSKRPKKKSVRVKENCFPVKVDKHFKNTKKESTNSQFFFKDEDFPILQSHKKQFVKTLEPTESEILNKNIHFEDDMKKKTRRRKEDQIKIEVTPNLDLRCYENEAKKESLSNKEKTSKPQEKYKVSPILIDPKIHKIIEVGSNDMVGSKENVKNKNFKTISCEVMLTKSQKKNRRRRKLKQQQNNINEAIAENKEEASKKRHEKSVFSCFQDEEETISKTKNKEVTNGHFFIEDIQYKTDRNEFIGSQHFEDDTKKKSSRKMKKNCVNTDIITPNQELESLNHENTKSEVSEIVCFDCRKEKSEKESFSNTEEKPSKPQKTTIDNEKTEDLKLKNIHVSNSYIDEKNKEKDNQFIIEYIEFIESLESKEPESLPQIFAENNCTSIECQTDLEPKEVTSSNSQVNSFDQQKYSSFSVITRVTLLFFFKSFFPMFDVCCFCCDFTHLD